MRSRDSDSVVLAALLHDLGKFWQRTCAGRTYPHEEYSRRFVEEEFPGYFQACGDDLAHAIAHHHRWPRVESDCDKLVILADWLSANEHECEDRDQEEPAHAPLVSLLSRQPIAPPGTPELSFPLSQLNWQSESAFFADRNAVAGPDIYARLWQEFRTEFAQMAGSRVYVPADLTTIVALLRKYTSRMPAAPPWEKDGVRTVPDISLYDHLKTTAALAACLQRQLGPDGVGELLAALTARQRLDGRLGVPICVLVKGDISGTQDFLYLLTSKGAARGLRGRSFDLQQLTETIARWILRKLDLPVTNLLLAAGGHFYLVLPYQQAARELDVLRSEIASRVWKAHQGDLSFIIASVPVAARDFLGSPDATHAFSERWAEVSRVVNACKSRRWRELNDCAVLRVSVSAPGSGRRQADL